MNRKLIYFLLIIFVLLTFAYIFYPNSKDFVIDIGNRNFGVIVEMPSENMAKHPLIIYQHDSGYSEEKLDLRNVAKRLASQGFEVWVPERYSEPRDNLQKINESNILDEKLLEMAMSIERIDKNDINLVGSGLGAWTIFYGQKYSSKFRTLCLAGFGAPYGSNNLSIFIKRDINTTDYSKIGPDILILVSLQDEKVDIDTAENLRNNLDKTGNDVAAIEYNYGSHMSFVGSGEYLDDIAKYIKGEEIQQVRIIKKINMTELGQKMGYW